MVPKFPICTSFRGHIWVIECLDGDEWAFVTFTFTRAEVRVTCAMYRRWYPGVEFHNRKYFP